MDKRYFIHISVHEMPNRSTEQFGRGESKSAAPSRQYDEGWDRVFGKKNQSN